MHPEHNIKRRTARAKALLQEREQQNQLAVILDAAWVKGKEAYAAILSNYQGKVQDAITIFTKNPMVAEKEAIALAIRSNKWAFIYSDSKSAIKGLDRGYVAGLAAKLIENIRIRTEIRWFLAHMAKVGETR